MKDRLNSKVGKQLESLVGKSALRFQPFSKGRVSESVFNTFILSILAQEGPCWPYRILQLFWQQWEREENQSKLKAIGLERPSELTIYKRIQNLAHDGFIRSLTPSELEKIQGISDRVRERSKVYDLSRRGFAVSWLLSPVRGHDETMMKVLKRRDPDGTHKMPGARVLWKLMERRKVGYVLRRAFTIGSVRLLSEVEEDEIEYGISASDLGEDEEDLLWGRYAQHTFSALLDIINKVETLPQNKRAQYLRAIGPPERILEECQETGKMIKEDPDMRESFAIFKQMVIDGAQRLGV